MRTKELVISQKWSNAKSGSLKGIKAVFIYNMLREGVPNSNGILEKRIQKQ